MQHRGQRAARTAAVATALLAVACGSTVQVADEGAPSIADSPGAFAAPDDSGLTLDPSDVGGSAISDGGTSSTTTGSTSGSTSAGTTSGSSSPSGSSTGGGSSSTTGSGGGSVGGTTGSTSTGGGSSARGVTPTQIKIGVVGLDQGGTAQTGAIFGADVPNPGDPKRQTAAIVKYINERGGIAGREVVAVVVNRDPQSGDPNQLEKICAAMTQDHRVFAVITNATDDTDACYAQHDTLLLNDGVESETEVLQPLDPYAWVPGLPSFEDGFAAHIDSLKPQGFFDGKDKLGLIADDDPRVRRVYESVVVPGLRRAGHPADVQIFVKPPESSTDYGTWSNDIQGAVLKMNTEGVTHVIFMSPGGGMPLLYMNHAESQGYRPRYALSSYDTPGLILQNSAPPQQLNRSLGAGFLLTGDVDPQNGPPYPTGPAEEQCVEALRSNGDAPPQTRAQAINASFICDGFFMLQAAGEGLDDDLTVRTWAAAAERLGTKFQATYSLPNGTKFVPGLRAGGQFYRWLQFVTSCKCFRYASENKPFPDA